MLRCVDERVKNRLSVNVLKGGAGHLYYYNVHLPVIANCCQNVYQYNNVDIKLLQIKLFLLVDLLKIQRLFLNDLDFSLGVFGTDVQIDYCGYWSVCYWNKKSSSLTRERRICVIYRRADISLIIFYK